MEVLLEKLEENLSWKQSMRKTCRVNKLNIEIVSYFTPLKIKSVYEKFKAIYEVKEEVENDSRWLQNELKTFYWVVVALSTIDQVQIRVFEQQQWNWLNKIFYFKELVTLEYEIMKLLDETSNKMSWLIEEQSLLLKIIQESKQSNKWNQLARKLFSESKKKFYRTGKQCRERWFNHLDPVKRRGEWTQEEDRQLAQLYLQHGKRWSHISKLLGSVRTEHMIKNHYKSLLIRQKKIYPHMKENQLINTLIEKQKILEKQVFVEEDIEIEGEKEQIEVDLEVKIEKSIKIQQNKKEQTIIPECFEKLEEDNINIMEEVQETRKNTVQNSYQMPQVYSPWFFNFPMTPTPTFSPNYPYFMNYHSFSQYEGNRDFFFGCSKEPSNQK